MPASRRRFRLALIQASAVAFGGASRADALLRGVLEVEGATAGAG